MRIKPRHLALFLLLALGCMAGGTEVGQRAPDFMAHLASGERFYLNSWKGSPLVVHFLATWCEPCRREIEMLDSIKQKQAGSFKLLGVLIDPENSALLSDWGISHPVVLDQGQKVYFQWKVPNLPATYLLDKRHVVRARCFSADEKCINDLVNSLGSLIVKR